MTSKSQIDLSLAASAANGTVAAIRAQGPKNPVNKMENSCIVIVSRFPLSSSRFSLSSSASVLAGSSLPSKHDDSERENALSNAKLLEESDNACDCMDSNVYSNPCGEKGKYLPRGLVPNTLGRKDEGMLHVLHEGAVVATTGFASDARYLMQCAAEDVYCHEQLHGVNPHSLPSLKRVVVDKIANRVSHAAFSDEDRPFGVQVMVVGKSWGRGGCNKAVCSATKPTPPLSMYTIDPSGGWRRWTGSAAVIGQHADIVRQTIYSRLVKENETRKVVQLPKNIEEAAEVGMRAIIDVENETKRECMHSREVLSQFQVIVMSTCSTKCAKLSDRKILDIYERHKRAKKYDCFGKR